eukprot:3219422-Pyramimonas_sp.AAC.1
MANSTEAPRFLTPRQHTGENVGERGGVKGTRNSFLDPRACRPLLGSSALLIQGAPRLGGMACER